MKLATSALGTKRTSAIAPMMSVVRGKAEVGFQGSHAPFDLFETLPFQGTAANMWRNKNIAALAETHDPRDRETRVCARILAGAW
jgi:hypothetical protein